jgi:hypothetical protein
LVRFRRAALAAVAAVVVPCLALAASAASAPTSASASAPTAAEPSQGSGAVVTFGVQPSGPTKADARGYFDFSSTPGGQLVDHIAVTDYAYQPLTLTLHASDALNTAQGAFALAPPNQPAKDVGSWIKFSLPQPTIVVPPRGVRIIEFQLAVPKNATPGDHAGGIVVTLQSIARSKSGQQYQLLQSVGSRLFLRVSGPLHPALAISGLTAQYGGTLNPVGSGHVDISYTVQNTGNVALGGRQNVSVTGLFGSKRSAHGVAPLQLLLPGSSVKEHVKLSDVFPELSMTAHVSIAPLILPGSVQSLPTSYHASTGFRAVPWTLIAIIVVVVAVLGWLFHRRRRRRRPAKRAGAPDPTDPQPSEVAVNGSGHPEVTPVKKGAAAPGRSAPASS